MKEYKYRTGEVISKGDLITVDYGYEYCLILEMLIDEKELKKWGWEKNPGEGVFVYSYLNEDIGYLPMSILLSEETRFYGRCPLPIFRENAYLCRKEIS
jgi:hypothetical protein